MKGTRLRLVSWNVHGTPTAPRVEERLAAIAGVIAALEPDLVLLQEVWRWRDAEALEKTLAPRGFRVVSLPSGGVWIRRSGLLAFVRSATGWHAEAEGFHEFRAEAPAWKIWEGDGFGDKGVQSFTLADEGMALRVLNTHLQAAYEPGGYAEVRRAQLVELRAVAEAEPTLPVLVAGDFNTTPDEPGWQELRGFRDLAAPLRESCRCGTTVSSAEPSQWIDHLLARLPRGWRIRARVSLLRSDRPDVPYSDHHGLEAVLHIAPPAPPVVHGALEALAALGLAGPATRREFLAWLGALAAGA